MLVNSVNWGTLGKFYWNQLWVQPPSHEKCFLYSLQSCSPSRAFLISYERPLECYSFGTVIVFFFRLFQLDDTQTYLIKGNELLSLSRSKKQNNTVSRSELDHWNFYKNRNCLSRFDSKSPFFPKDYLSAHQWHTSNVSLSKTNTSRSSCPILYTEVCPPFALSPLPDSENCQSQSNLWNIFKVTIYAERRR